MLVTDGLGSIFPQGASHSMTTNIVSVISEGWSSSSTCNEASTQMVKSKTKLKAE